MAIIDHYSELAQFGNTTGKVAVFSLVASELSRYSPKPNPWSWQYVQGLATGRMKESKYIKEAIIKLSDEIAGKPKMGAGVICPVHGKVCAVDCTKEAVYTPATQEVFPVGQAVIKKPRKPYTRRERPHFDALVIARAWMGLEV